MKRLVLSVVFLLALCTTAALAASPVVTLDKAFYTDDNTLVDLSAIVPNRPTSFHYIVKADTPAIQYRRVLQTGSRNGTEAGTRVGKISPLVFDLAPFSPSEQGDLALTVTDGNGLSSSIVTHMKAEGVSTPPGTGQQYGISFKGAEYADDRSPVDLSKIKPYRDIELLYSVSSDTPQVKANFTIRTGNRVHVGGYTTVPHNGIFPLPIKQFSPLESGQISLEMHSALGRLLGADQKSLRAVDGVPPTYPVAGVALREAPLGAIGNSIKATIHVDVDDDLQLEAVISPTNASNKAVQWTSSNEKIAKVDAKGLVKGLASGDAIITVTTVEGKFKATCKVTVLKRQPKTPAPALKIVLVPDLIDLVVGEQVKVIVSSDPIIMPFDAPRWTFKDTTIASNDSEFWDFCYVKALKPGKTTLTFSAKMLLDQREGSAVCNITVREKAQPQPQPIPQPKPIDPAPQPLPKPEPSPEPNLDSPEEWGNKSGSSSGCNAGLAGLLALALVPMVGGKRSLSKRGNLLTREQK